MKHMFLLMVVSMSVLSCESDVSHVMPHRSLVGSVWTLRQDAYVIEYRDSVGKYFVFPCVSNFASRFPDRDYVYDENNIGLKYSGSDKIVGGMRAGESVKVLRVVEVRNPEAGTSHRVWAIPLKGNRWTGEKQLDMQYYYHAYDSMLRNGELDDEYLTKVR